MTRAQTQYMASNSQMLSKKLGIKGGGSTEAKDYYRIKEAQIVFDQFRDRVEDNLAEDLETWELEKYKGDLVRKAIGKLHVGGGEYIHVHATKPKRAVQWQVMIATDKTKEDPLLEDVEEYEDATGGGCVANVSTCFTQ